MLSVSVYVAFSAYLYLPLATKICCSRLKMFLTDDQLVCKWSFKRTASGVRWPINKILFKLRNLLFYLRRKLFECRPILKSSATNCFTKLICLVLDFKTEFFLLRFYLV